MSESTVCLTCGKVLPPQGLGRRRKYCDLKCKPYKAWIAGRHKKVCPACGVTFMGAAQAVYCTHICKVRNRVRREAAAGKQTYCQAHPEYRQPSKQICCVSYPACVECGRTFCAHRGTSRYYCSAPCREVAEKKRYREWYDRVGRDQAHQAWLDSPEAKQAYRHESVCRERGKVVVGHGRMRYCSARCSARRQRRVMRTKHGRRRQPGGNWNHRHLKRVAERDGWRCHLCGKKVASGQESVDHLVPRSAGGLDRMDNVALAHRPCNTLRSDKGKAQLRLIG